MAGHLKILCRRVVPALTHCPVARNSLTVTKTLAQNCNNFQRLQYHTLLGNISRNIQVRKSTQNTLSSILNPPSLLSNVSSIRNFSFGRKDKQKSTKKRVPKLILMQNPFTWLMIKIDFKVLKHIWDPTFVEKEFKFGTKQAISRVTQVISSGQFAELNGLLTKPARQSLMREIERNWGEKQRSLLELSRDDIQISSPRKVYFIRIADKKYCDVDMSFLALKWTPVNSVPVLLFTEIFARFHREYTPHSIPEWTIAYFKVTRFEVIRRS